MMAGQFFNAMEAMEHSSKVIDLNSEGYIFSK